MINKCYKFFKKLMDSVRRLKLFFQNRGDFPKNQILNVACFSNNEGLIKKAIAKAPKPSYNSEFGGGYHITIISNSIIFDEEKKLDLINLILDKNLINKKLLGIILMQILDHINIAKLFFDKFLLLDENYTDVINYYGEKDNLQAMVKLKGHFSNETFYLGIATSIRFGYVDIFDYFFENDDIKDDYIIDWFFAAGCQSDNYRVVESLLKKGHNFDRGLIECAIRHSKKCFDLFVFHCDPDYVYNNSTALMQSINYGNKKLYRKLLKISDINKRVSSKSALIEAMEYYYETEDSYFFEDLLNNPKLIIQIEDIEHSIYKDECLSAFLERPEFKIEYFSDLFDDMIRKNMKMSFRNFFILFDYGYFKDLDIEKFFNSRDDRGEYPLFKCIGSERIGFLRFLVTRPEIDFNVVDKNGNNILGKILINNFSYHHIIELTNIVIERCDVNHVNNQGDSIFKLMMDNYDLKLLEKIIDKININKEILILPNYKILDSYYSSNVFNKIFFSTDFKDPEILNNLIENNQKIIRHLRKEDFRIIYKLFRKLPENEREYIKNKIPNEIKFLVEKISNN